MSFETYKKQRRSIFETSSAGMQATRACYVPVPVCIGTSPVPCSTQLNDGKKPTTQAIAVVNHEGWRRRHRLRVESDDAVAATSNIDRSSQLRRRRFAAAMAMGYHVRATSDESLLSTLHAGCAMNAPPSRQVGQQAKSVMQNNFRLLDHFCLTTAHKTC